MKTEQKPQQAAPTEPDPKEWIRSKTEDITLQNLLLTRDFLKDAGLWTSSLSYWIRLQITSEINWDEDTITNEIKPMEKAWLESNNIEEANITTEELRNKLHVTAACTHWCNKQWGHRVDSLYLQKKSDIDRASCRLLRISDKDFANELYHRVKAKETSFEEVARKYGEGSERVQGGMIPMQPMTNMPFGLGPLLERLKPGEVSTPLRLGKGFCMVELLKYVPSKLDESTADVLLKEQFKLWMVSVVEIVDAGLN